MLKEMGQKGHMRIYKTVPQCESHRVELIFAQLFVKVSTICLVCGQSQDTQLARSIKMGM